jgi:Helix-turn-helix domain
MGGPMSARAHRAGTRWTTRHRRGASHREAGAKGGQARCWAPPRSALTRQEAAMRWAMGESTQAELATEYDVSRSTMRRWCAWVEAGDGEA